MEAQQLAVVAAAMAIQRHDSLQSWDVETPFVSRFLLGFFACSVPRFLLTDSAPLTDLVVSFGTHTFNVKINDGQVCVCVSRWAYGAGVSERRPEREPGALVGARTVSLPRRGQRREPYRPGWCGTSSVCVWLVVCGAVLVLVSLLRVLQVVLQPLTASTLSATATCSSCASTAAR